MQMTLLNQELAAEHGIYFEDCDTEPGTEWTSFLRKSQEKIQQEPWLALAFSVDYKEGYPGGWSTGSESVPAGPGAEVPEDPNLKVMRRLDQGALVKRLQEGASIDGYPVEVAGGAIEVPRDGGGYEEPIGEGGGTKVLIEVGDGDGLHVEKGGESSLPVGEGGESEMLIVERGGNIESDGEEGAVGEAGASVLGENSSTSLALVEGIKPTAHFNESVGEEEADRNEKQRFWMFDEQESVGNPEDETLPPSTSKAAALFKTRSGSQADQLFASELSRLLRSIPGWSEKSVGYRHGTSKLKLKYHREAIWSVDLNGEDVDAGEGDETIVASSVLELYGVSSPWHIHTAPKFSAL
jgi:hypothetical protein